MRSRCPGASVAAILVVVFAAACHSDHSNAPADRGEIVHAPVVPAATLAKSYGLEIRPEVTDGVPIRVVDAASGRPVSDALIVTVDESEFTYDDAGDGGVTWNSHTLLKKLGQAYVTSIDGAIRVANPTAPCSVFVWHGNDFGRTTLEVHDREEHVVSLAPRALMVEVVDRAGRPQAGVPIQLAQCSTEPMSLGTTVGITSADGRFAIPALELEKNVHRSCGRRDLVMLGCMVGGFELRPVDVPVLEPVRMVLPDSGTVDIDLEDAQGRPLTQDSGRPRCLWLRFHGAKRGEPLGLERQRTEEGERSLVVQVESGHVRLERVEVGMHLSFKLEVRTSETSSTLYEICAVEPVPSDEIQGPTKAGELCHVVLRTDWSGGEDEEAHEGDTLEPRVDKSSNDMTDEAIESDSTLDPESSIEIAVRVDDPIDPCWLSARLDGNCSPLDNDSSPWIDVNGRATMRGITAGTHSVTITQRGLFNFFSETAICTIDGVEVARAQHLRDPRLLNIDLRGKLNVHRLEVVDEAGLPLSGCVRVTRDGDAEFEDRLTFENGRVDFLNVVGDGVHACVAVDRFRPFELDLNDHEGGAAAGAAGRRRVVMKRGIPIRLALDPGFALPSDPHDRIYVGVSEAPHWEESLDTLRTVELRPDADLRFDVAGPGDSNVIFLLSHDNVEREPTVSECHSIETAISVAEESREQTIVVAPDRDCWDALMRKLAH